MGSEELIMARPYSEKYLLSIDKLDPTRAGVQLGKLCVQANLPITYIAKAFNVSRMSIHSWFRGQYIREKNYFKIDNFLKIVQTELDKGSLPAPSLEEAKKFIDKKIIDKI
jgi:hypothetical protein